MNLRDQIIDNLNRDNIFFLSNYEKKSYKELKKYVSLISSDFNQNNINRILICSKKSFISYSLVIGAYLSGTTFCIVDTKAPKHKKELVLAEYNPDLIFVDKEDGSFSKLEYCYDINKYISTFDSYEQPVASLQKSFNEIVYVLYTSGSEGQSKGVRILRRSLEKLVCWAVKEFKLSSDDIWGQYAPMCFDMSIFDIFGAVYIGATLVPFEKLSERLFPGKIIKKYKITFINAVPQIIDVLTNANQLCYEYLHTLKKIKLGGDRVYSNKLASVFDILPDIDIIVTYGPTETTIFCTYLFVNKNNYNDYSKTTISIGKCVPGWNIIIDKPTDNIGEFIIYGNYIGMGYVSEKGNHSFRTLLINEKKERAYYSGDFGYVYNEHFYFYGRKDSQIKINGNRVDTSEIDFQFKQIGCELSHTLVRNNMIISFFISLEMDYYQVYEKLRLVLHDYQLPSKMIKINEFPWNENGKIDTALLIKEYNI